MDEPQTTPQPVLARAAVHLPGLTLGALTWVDPTADYIRDCFEKGLLVLVEEQDVR